MSHDMQASKATDWIRMIVKTTRKSSRLKINKYDQSKLDGLEHWCSVMLKNTSWLIRMDWNIANLTLHYIRYWIQLFPTVKKYLSWGSRARPYSPACLIQQESVVTPTLLCKPLICLWSLFEMFHIFCEGSAGRGIVSKDKPNTDIFGRLFWRGPHPVLICPGALAANLELWNISQVETCPGELQVRHSKCSHLQLYNKTQSFKSALKGSVPKCN